MSIEFKAQGPFLLLSRANVWTANQRLDDDVHLMLGTDSDIRILLNSAAVAANVEVTNVIVGTSAHAGFEANTLVISNVTTDGDIVLLASDGGNSGAYLWVDASAGLLFLYSRTGDLTLDSASETNYAFAGSNYHALNIRGLSLGGLASAGAGVPSGASNFLELNNGAPPTTMNANSAGVYAKDVDATSEVFARGEDDTESQISPHPPDFLATLPLPADQDSIYNFPWAIHNASKYLGLEMHVDMAGVVAAVEALTSRSFHTFRRFSTASWADNQQEKVRRNTEARRLAGLAGERIPSTYQAKPVPPWLASRGVT
jgi:hypothetical protein